MGKIKSVFVILHYNEKAVNDTIECVESIHSAFKIRDDYRIIIVENGSEDNSADILKDNFDKDKRIQLIISEQNLGFAKGNNLGCKKAIELYQPEFLIVINNDTIIQQKEFLSKLYMRYEKNPFDILGPFIYDRNLLPQNPVLHLRITKDEVERSIKENQEYLSKLDSKNYRFKMLTKKYLKQIIESNSSLEKIIKKLLKKERVTPVVIREELNNVGLHGSALVFTRRYYERYEDIFNPNTFMFVEEDILLYRVLQDKLTSVYYPDIEIYHKEDCSTDATITSTIQQMKFKVENEIKSLEIYRKIINGEI